MLGWDDDRALATLLPAKEAKAIAKTLGYTTASELLAHHPRTYAHQGQGVGALNCHEGDIVTCVGDVARVQARSTQRGEVITVAIATPEGTLNASFFNATWVKRLLQVGVRAIFTGKVKFFRGQPGLQHPEFIVLPEPGHGNRTKGTAALRSLQAYSEDGDVTELLENLDSIPIYPAKSSMPTWRILGAIHEVLRKTDVIPDPLGRFAPHDLPSFDATLRGIHQDGGGNVEMYRNRLIYDEALTLALVMELRRQDAESKTAPALMPVDGGLAKKLMAHLPYKLTGGQKRVMWEIAEDLSQTHPMQRLLQGEVGSGKTVVSLVAMLQAVENGAQCALLAPTEVLAHQHGRSLTDLLQHADIDCEVVVLTGSLPVAKKKEALLKIVSGDADIVVGTHALIQDTVEFFNLGLCVVDEQHRFGVEQRDNLRGKGKDGKTPHLLVMTATPIPRTVAMTFFGDLNHSILKELPGGRRPIKSFVVPEYLPKYVARVFEVIEEEVAKGHQAYIVCPRISDEGGVEDLYQNWGYGIFKNHRVGMLHGQMHPEDKDKVMGQFANHEIDILFATTVIEVGIDVPNATVMLVRESENFGVSQLHQLRGRVGRGGNESICFFHHASDKDSPADLRLRHMAQTTDGFEVADIDLLYRQEGDVLGTTQSGNKRKVKYLNLVRDFKWIERANADAKVIVAQDPSLAKQLVASIDDRAQDYLDKS
ncbi:MAG: ATP-dependent DNA helicase RecG [Corynebacterium sp.]|uniref:ATP-dependent DNA helicase RecG n=1 Tax=Corynebacterium sp. TaxID=1720 RepID=UPI0026DDA401|nr:ATP-dependent DNA helicase RecG [Corynebacterium sp.]MDO5099293.1 ATP-dependent DNA helicase RecG [Corynebacterium sp.]